MFGIVLVLIAVLFLAQSLYLARLMVPNQDESAGLFAGYLVASGRLSLLDDAMPGHRAPAPAYIFGATQVLSGRSLLAARHLGAAFGFALVLTTGLLAPRLAGDLAGLIVAVLLAAQAPSAPTTRSATTTPWPRWCCWPPARPLGRRR